ncbi:glycosyltransferase family 4 protein [Candidatus Pacebacteria bacterium]|nr:glycosyltransferase family 4 protein [Candidatus Paceibacterota bacterium]
MSAKITYLAHLRFPSERAHAAQVAHMCSAFAQNEAAVTLLVPWRQSQVPESAFTYYNLPAEFAIRHIFCTPWNVSTRLGYWSSLLVYAIRSVLIVYANKTDLVYSRDEVVLWVLSLFYQNKRLIWESHEAKYNFFARALFQRGVKCVVISEGIRDRYRQHGISAEQLLVAHDGIDESFFGQLETKDQARTRLGISTENPVVMYIGGLDAWKGVETLLAASQVVDAVTFTIIGGKDDEVKLCQAQYPKVQFLGSRPYRELPSNQQAADLLVIPNTAANKLSSAYTSPLKLFAHLASGIPLVVSDIASLRTVVTEEEVTFFLPDNPEDLAAKIKSVLSAGQANAYKQQNALAKARCYTWRERATQIMQFSKLDTRCK